MNVPSVFFLEKPQGLLHRLAIVRSRCSQGVFPRWKAEKQKRADPRFEGRFNYLGQTVRRPVIHSVKRVDRPPLPCSGNDEEWQHHLPRFKGDLPDSLSKYGMFPQAPHSYGWSVHFSSSCVFLFLISISASTSPSKVGSFITRTSLPRSLFAVRAHAVPHATGTVSS